MNHTAQHIDYQRLFILIHKRKGYFQRNWQFFATMRRDKSNDYKIMLKEGGK